jgi:hypothetical protein
MEGLYSHSITNYVRHSPSNGPGNAKDEDGINLKAAFCMGFAAFLRSGEFTWDTWSPESYRLHLSRKHIVFRSDGSLILTLRSSKTGESHSSTEIFLARFPYAYLSYLCSPLAVPTLPCIPDCHPVFKTTRPTVFEIIFRPCHAQPSS